MSWGGIENGGKEVLPVTTFSDDSGFLSLSFEPFKAFMICLMIVSMVDVMEK